MGLVYANIELSNAEDTALQVRGLLGEDEIRKITVNMLVDSGAVMLVINESLRKLLGLRIKGKRISQLADGRTMELLIAGPVDVKFEDRSCTTNALAFPGDDAEPLLGAIPMEEMDLFIHPARNILSPVHPEGPVMMLK